MNRSTIIFFHGNSFDIGERAYKIKFYIDEVYGIYSMPIGVLVEILGTQQKKINIMM